MYKEKSKLLTNLSFFFYSFLGSPFFHSMIAKSRPFPSDIFVIIDPETVILSGFISTVNHVYELDRDWLLVASPQNAFNLDNAERMLIAWNNKDMPLHNGVLPPFIYGKGTLEYGSRVML